MTLRLRGKIKSPRMAANPIARPARRDSEAEKRRVWFGGKPLVATIYERELLMPGKKLSGPAILTEYSATTVVPARNGLFYR